MAMRWVPAVGLATGTSIFSRRPSFAWGAAGGILGLAWNVLVLEWASRFPEPRAAGLDLASLSASALREALGILLFAFVLSIGLHHRFERTRNEDAAN